MILNLLPDFMQTMLRRVLEIMYAFGRHRFDFAPEPVTFEHIKPDDARDYYDEQPHADLMEVADQVHHRAAEESTLR